ncbi:MAG: biopolymer transporter ExbD [Planctomycetes bacterium]|nr:biopolymer transporter ExbD [Planctomycetota bacterium]MBI3835132.1 biopolymer transporter ExbD [Planctomycetota bacterium]
MRRFVRRERQHPPIGFIILPMVDVIFLLLLFFVIVTSFDASARIRVDVPKPDKSLAERDASAKQVVINCEVGDEASPETGEVLYRIGADPPEDLSEIVDRLKSAREINPQLSVVIRADRRLAFSQVQAVMESVASANVMLLKVAALQDTGER